MNEFNFNAEDRAVDDVLFTQNRFRIPAFQRPYSWDIDQINEFWNDIRMSKSSFFLGSFVFNLETKSKDNVIEVIDGQQRLLSITLLMAVLRDCAKDIKDAELARRIQTNCIAFEDKKGNHTYRIECADSLKSFFVEHIQKDNRTAFPLRFSRPEHKLIAKNYNSLKSEVEAELSNLSSLSDKVERLHEIWSRVGDLKVIWIEIASEDAAYTIFETVNARGAELSVADLLKNLILKNVKKTDGGLEKARQKWSQIEENIIDTDIELSKFVRHLWLSKYDFVGEKDLYRDIRREISNFEKFLDELVTASQLYRLLLKGSKEEWIEFTENGRKIYQSLLGIRVMRVTQCYVFFLGVLRNMSKIDFDVSRCFEAVEKFTFLYSSISKLQANKVEKIYSSKAIALETALKEKNPKLLKKNVQKTFDHFISDLKDLVPEYPVFLEKFKEIEYKKSEAVRVFLKYLLAKINRTESKNELSLDFDVVNIEHIIPQTPSGEWKLSKQDIAEYVNSIGNLVLLSKILNSEASNSILKKKIPIIQDSEIITTRKLVDSIAKNGYRWGEKEVVERVTDLAKLAYNTVWKI